MGVSNSPGPPRAAGRRTGARTAEVAPLAAEITPFSLGDAKDLDSQDFTEENRSRPRFSRLSYIKSTSKTRITQNAQRTITKSLDAPRRACRRRKFLVDLFENLTRHPLFFRVLLVPSATLRDCYDSPFPVLSNLTYFASKKAAKTFF